MQFSKFQKPDSRYRPCPFWSINDQITPEETAWQMADMIDKGFGGGFFHSRIGLITEYMGAEWMEAVKAAIKAAEEKNGYLWLYDEDQWPSGNAGGQIGALGDDFRVTYLEAILLPAHMNLEDIPDSEVKQVYTIKRREGMRLLDYEMLGSLDERGHDAQETLVVRKRLDVRYPVWADEPCANLLNPNVTTEFIKRTHEEYKKYVGKHFGKRVPGIFTDEPQLYQGAGIPWYKEIPTRYKEWFGREFWMDLPWMFFDGPQARMVRLCMHRTIHRQMVTCYSKPIYEWCTKNKLVHTGHYNAEDTLESQIFNHGGGVMSHYRYQHNPGVDHLCRETHKLLLTLKQVSSAARQLGREPALNEIFGVSHNTNTFEDFRWIGDYSLVQGAVFFCPHLTWYSMRGARKRDYPPNWNYQQTYWEQLKPLNDYFSRLGAVLSTGKAKVDVLVLHPIEDAMASLRRDMVLEGAPMTVGTKDVSRTAYLDQILRRIMTAVQDAGYDFDLGDEGYLADLGSVKGRSLKVGEAQYGLVIVPPAFTWRSTTFSLLKKYGEAGGRILFAGNLPSEIDCEEASAKWKALLQARSVIHVPLGYQELMDALAQNACSDYSLRQQNGSFAPGIRLQRRIHRGQQFFFVVNNDRDCVRDLKLRLFHVQGDQADRWDAWTGERQALAVAGSGSNRRIRFSLGPTDSILLAIGKDVGANTKQVSISAIETKCHALPEAWSFTRSEGNVLVLDRLSFSLDHGKTWSDEELDHRIRRDLALRFGISLCWQPWMALRKGTFKGKGGPVVLRYRFHSDIAKVEQASLVVEDIQKGCLQVNDQSVDTAHCGWHWDRGFGKVDITRLIRRGPNEVLFFVDYDHLTMIEPAYVVGDFGVQLLSPTTGEICREPKVLVNGSWVGQGFPFYSGCMTYCTQWCKPSKGRGRYFLRLRGASMVLGLVRINGKKAGMIPWRPHEIEITKLLKPGKNAIEIVVVSSRQNTHGPLHVREGDSYRWFGPPSFEDDRIVVEPYCLFNYGLMDGAEIVERK